ncbi:MAG: hypothetical protein H7838_02345 [Magnetococcus sp. DMHC-8]
MNQPDASHLLASCTLQVSAGQPPDPFVLQTGHDLGSRPVRLQPVRVNAWSLQTGIHDRFLPMAMQMQAPGLQRVRLYCADRPAQEVRLLVDGEGSARCLGRRQEPVVEILTWVQSRSQPLRFGYDQPPVTIRESTRFFDNDGQEVARPLYRSDLGAFQHGQPVTGALVVEYRPACFLYEIAYGTGEQVASAQGFQALKRAWLAGNIHDAVIPPVHIIALSRHQAAQLTLPRRFWPNSSSATLQFQDTEALQLCTEEHGQERYQYVENGRETAAERIYSRHDPNSYVDILRTVAISFERQAVNGVPCTEAAAGGPSPQMLLRFQNPGFRS